ncbi:hypothetical protein L596_027964 [Steinernema carpocapsae]|uniref:SSD domain-containing protein n=1 Tax=Steinernema carpocapsae TaxID=34508 RepID=A0A4U5LX26_STECR|nr:hypothetical protein L596_027964 [Steinernema carpocapsae]
MFLLLAVGVDDVFINAGRVEALEQRRFCGGARCGHFERVGLLYDDLTITSITNFLSFAVGMTSTTQALYAFGVYSAVAIVVCYFFQIFIFPAVLVLTGVFRKSSCLPQEIKCISYFGCVHDAFFKLLTSVVINWIVKMILMITMVVTGSELFTALLKCKRFECPETRDAQLPHRGLQEPVRRHYPGDANDDTLFVTRATSQTPPKWSVWNP